MDQTCRAELVVIARSVVKDMVHAEYRNVSVRIGNMVGDYEGRICGAAVTVGTRIISVVLAPWS